MCFSKVEKSPAGRKTRAASRAATTSRARNTRATKKASKNKSKSQEPVAIIEQIVQANIEQLNETGKQKKVENEELDETMHEVIEIWTQPASESIKLPESAKKANVETPHRNSAGSSRKSRASELEETMYEVVEMWTEPINTNIVLPEAFKNTDPKTPIQNFSSMNVKEKVHAYEEIITISPMTVSAKKMSVSPNNSDHLKTPARSTIPQNTPDTVVRKHDSSAEMECSEESEDIENVLTKKTSSSRIKKRSSVCKSLKVLPSTAKIQAVHQEVRDLIVFFRSCLFCLVLKIINIRLWLKLKFLHIYTVDSQ